MFSNRVFNAAFLISLTWHLICMFAVNIVVLPGRYRTRELTSVSFLGPILGKTALEIIFANKPVGLTTIYQRDLRYSHTIGKKEKPPLRNNIKRHIYTRAEDGMDSVFGRVPRKDKEIPDIITKTHSREGYFASLSEISGPLSDREVIYRPEKPKLPQGITANPPFKLELKFVVSAIGEVKEVIPIISSGSPDVDLLGIRYLKSWRFAPLAQNSDKGQSGRMKFVFEKE